MFKKNSIRGGLALPFLRLSRGFVRPLAIAFLAAFLLCGCRMIAPLPPANVSAPGWKRYTGQAVWRSDRHSPEIAGDLFVAINPDGRSFVQFTKTPFPMVIAQTTADAWQIEDPRAKRIYAFRGRPPAGLIWLQLPASLGGKTPKKLRWTQDAQGEFRLENPSSGEVLDGFLSP